MLRTRSQSVEETEMSNPEIIGKCAADLRVKRFEGRNLVCCSPVLYF